MKKIISAIICAVLVFNMSVCLAVATTLDKELRDAENIDKVSIDWQGTWTTRDDHPNYAYEYETEDKAEIEYIRRMLSSIELTRTDYVTTFLASHFEAFHISLCYADGEDPDNQNMKWQGVLLCDEGIYFDENKKEYTITTYDYERFLSLIGALKAGTIDPSGGAETNPSEWARENIQKALSYGLISGVDCMGYTKAITRRDACQLTARFLQTNGVEIEDYRESPFADVEDDFLTALYKLKVIDGKREGEFCPNELITREEMAKILFKAYELVNGGMEASQIAEYADRDEISDWARSYVDNLTQIGVVRGNDEGRFEPKRSITKEEMITLLCRMHETGCAEAEKPEASNAEQYGNTKGNIQEAGLICENNGILYYSDFNNNNYIYKTDGGKKTQLNSQPGYEINVMGDHIYYIDGETGSIYKMKTDGTENKKIFNKRADKPITTKDHLFFRVSSETAPGRLYRSDLNGENVKLLVDGMEDYVVNGNKIYYTDNNGFLYEADIDGRHVIRLSDVKAADINYSGGNIYFGNMDDGFKLYRMSIDSEEAELLVDKECRNINLNGDCIYFRNQSEGGSLWRTDLDGNAEAIAEGDITHINVFGQYVLFRRATENLGYFVYDTVSGEEKKVTDD